jgi:WD40 repeat protein
VAATTSPKAKTSAALAGSPAYEAFISYSHAADGHLAPALQRGLQSLAKPWYRRRALRVFRDETSLSASPALWPSIEQALSDAQYFVLLASPEAADSRWVDQEVRWWRAHRSHDTVLIALTDGELRWAEGRSDFDSEASIPPGLRDWFPSEPLWVDLRWARAERDVSMRNPRFRDAVGELAAPLHGLPKDELIGEDISQHRRTVRLARAAVASLAVLALVAAAAAVFAAIQRNQAREERDIAVSRQLASQAEDTLERDPTLSALLSLAAFESADTVEARSSLLLEATRRLGVKRILTDSPPLTPKGSGDWSADVAFGPDGRTLVSGALHGSILASGSSDGSVVLWDLDRRRRVGILRGHADKVNSVAFSPDGQTLASGGADRRVILWDVRARRRLGTLAGHTDWVQTVAFSRDGRTLASGGTDRRVMLWDVATRRRLGTLTAPGGLAPSMNQEGLDIGDERLYSWVQKVAFSPDGRTLASAGPDRRVHLWDVDGRRHLASLTGHTEDVHSVTFSPDGRTLASGGVDQAVILWDVSDQRQVATLTGHTDWVRAVAFSPDGRTLASSSADGSVFLWDPRGPPSLTGHRDTVQTVAFSPDGRTIASGAHDRQIILWNAARQRRLATLTSDTGLGGVPSVAFSPDGRTMASGSGDGAVILWDLDRRRELARLTGHNGGVLRGVQSVAFSRDGRVLASASDDGTVIVWDAVQRRRLGTLKGHTNGVNSVVFSPDGSALATAGDDNRVVLWDVARRQRLGTLTGHTGLGGVDSVAFSPDGRTLASAGSDERVVLWDVDRRRRVGVLSGHADWVHAVAFSPDGRTLASGSDDGSVILWDVDRRRELGSLTGRPISVNTLAFSPDGRVLAFGGLGASAGGPVDLRDVDVDAWQRRLCGLIDRDLTVAEWKEFVGEQEYRGTCD